MDWVLDHLQVIIAVAAAIAYWLNQRRQEQAGEADDASTGGTPRDFNADPEEAARTRRIQEEIRRKIAERAGGGTINVPPPAPEPPPLFRTDTSAPRPVASPLPQRETAREVTPAPVPPVFQSTAAAILERQRELASQMQALEAARRQVQQQATAVAFATPAAIDSTTRGGLFAELRGAQNLRRAIVLREVLGPPVAMR